MPNGIIRYSKRFGYYCLWNYISFVNFQINTFTTNLKWQVVRVVIGGQKKVILIVGSN